MFWILRFASLYPALFFAIIYFLGVGTTIFFRFIFLGTPSEIARHDYSMSEADAEASSLLFPIIWPIYILGLIMIRLFYSFPLFLRERFVLPKPKPSPSIQYPNALTIEFEENVLSYRDMPKRGRVTFVKPNFEDGIVKLRANDIIVHQKNGLELPLKVKDIWNDNAQEKALELAKRNQK